MTTEYTVFLFFLLILVAKTITVDVSLFVNLGILGSIIYYFYIKNNEKTITKNSLEELSNSPEDITVIENDPLPKKEIQINKHEPILSIMKEFIEFTKKEHLFDNITFKSLLNLIDQYYRNKNSFYKNEMIDILQNKEHVISDTKIKTKFIQFKQKIIDEINKYNYSLGDEEEPIPFYISGNDSYSVFME